MKWKLVILVLIAVLASSLAAAPPADRRSAPPMAQRIDNDTYINANRILMFVTNHGNFARDLGDIFGQDAGTFYPYTSIEDLQSGANNNYVLYAAGLWAGGLVNGDKRVIIAEYSDEYVPGPMADSTFQTDRPEFKVYKLFRDSLANNPNEDYLNWPVDQGAPVKMVDGEMVPDMIGDQMCWSVFNDANPDQHDNDAGKTEPLGLEVRQTTFAFDQTGSLANMIFVRLRVYNRGPNTIDSLFLSLWADPDLGGYTDDLVGCDSNRSLGYVYNADNDDSQYGSAPPALGFDFFQGPLVETGDMADTALMWDTIWPGYVNMGMYSFNKYINGTDPNDFNETYNYMKGLEATGEPYVFEGDTLLYVHTGDPRLDENDPERGDVDFNPADRRWMQSTGPLTFAPGDSTEILAAIIVGQGGNVNQSITQLITLDDFAQRVYEAGFNVAVPPASPNVHVSVVPGEVVLTWDDTSEVDPGTYPFQGYTVWQCNQSGSDCIELATYDIIDTTFTQAIIDTVLDPYSSVLIPNVIRALDNKGLRYEYRATQDAFSLTKIYDVSTYFYKVTAFSFASRDSVGDIIPYGDRFKESATSVTVTPQDYLPGVTPAGDAGDILDVTHANGGSSVLVQPYITDPLALNGHTYKVWFDSVSFDTVIDDIPTTLLDTAFNLMDMTTGDTLLKNRRNLTGQDRGEEPYKVTDGFQLVVSGSAGIDEIVEVAGAGGTPISPPDNVAYSLNSTADWYVSSDDFNNFDRLNWRGLIGIDDWEFRWVDSADGSQYYDYMSDMFFAGAPLAPFEVWNIGVGTPDDPSDDVRVQFMVIDDDTTGGWSYGDRIYVVEQPYSEPLPEPAVYTWDDDFHIGRIVYNDYSGGTTQPAPGTVVRFVTGKPPTPADTFTFVAAAPTMAASEGALDGIRVVPNPFYLFGPYDRSVGDHTIRFHGLPAECSIEIYNLSGEFIVRIDKDDPTTSIAEWNALTDTNVPVASGIYIYVVDAPGYGQKIGKFAVFMEVEVLQQY